MKRLVLTLSDAAFDAIKAESDVYNIFDALSVLSAFTGKVVRAIEGGEEALEIKTRTEREKDKEPCPKP